MEEKDSFSSVTSIGTAYKSPWVGFTFVALGFILPICCQNASLNILFGPILPSSIMISTSLLLKFHLNLLILCSLPLKAYFGVGNRQLFCCPATLLR